MEHLELYLIELREIDVKLTKLQEQLALSVEQSDSELIVSRWQQRIESIKDQRSHLISQFELAYQKVHYSLESESINKGGVRVRNTLCPGCQTRLSEFEQKLLQKQNAFTICATCGRIILSAATHTEPEVLYTSCESGL